MSGARAKIPQPSRWAPPGRGSLCHKQRARSPKPHSRDQAWSLPQPYSYSRGLGSSLACTRDAIAEDKREFTLLSVHLNALFLNSSSQNAGVLLSEKNLSPIYLKVCNQFPSQISMAGIPIRSHLLCTQWSPTGKTERLLLMVQLSSA